ncbi:MAG: hypothetical protein WCD07_08650 [Burkholderiales bacterium]
MDLLSTWIGDFDAFKSFQELDLAESISEHKSLFNDDLSFHLGGIFRELIASNKHPSVGNFVVTVTPGNSNNIGFRYSNYVSGSGFHPVENTTEPTSVLRSVGVGGGSFQFSILPPETPGIGALAVHIYEANLGAFFQPSTHWTPVLFKNISVDDFIDTVADRFGVKVGGIRVS